MCLLCVVEAVTYHYGSQPRHDIDDEAEAEVVRRWPAGLGSYLTLSVANLVHLYVLDESHSFRFFFWFSQCKKIKSFMIMIKFSFLHI